MSDNIVIDILEKGIAFKGGCYHFSGPLTDCVTDFIKNDCKAVVSHSDTEKLIYRFTLALAQFDNLVLPDGTTFTRSFPKISE